MHCQEAHILMAKRMKEGLNAEQDAALAGHFRTCAACRQEDATLPSFLGRILACKPESSSALRIPRPALDVILHHAQQRRRGFAWRAPALAFGCLAVLLLGLWIQQNHRVSATGRPTENVVHVQTDARPPYPQAARPRQPQIAETGTKPSARIPLAIRVRPRLFPESRHVPSVLRSAAGNSAGIPDASYLDGRDPQLAAYWAAGVNNARSEATGPSLPPVKDDFVRIPWPQIAGLDSRAVEAARRVYAQEAQIVDSRLFRKVTLHEKGASLETVCATLKKQTGVPLVASREVRDEKATVLVNKLPARDVMRAVARLFDCYWARSGEEGAYQYELRQDLKTQLAEEELRNKDFDAALLALDAAITTKASDSPALQAYQRLTPAERTSLRSGKEIRFSTDEELPTGFPPDWAQSLLESFGKIGLPSGDVTPAQTPGAVATLTFSLVRSELGQLSLDCESAVNPPGIGTMATLGTGRSPSSSSPNNRAANKEMQSDPALKGELSMAPKPCSKPDWKETFGIDFSKGRYIEDDIQESAQPPMPHVNSADVWEAVHEKTGLPIVADYYTHLYPASDFTTDKQHVFDALCRAADLLGVHWKKDNGILLCRSAGFFWDKLKEVPNRLLDKWQADRERNGGLPIDDLLEMATLTDQQLDSLFVGQGIKHCRDLMEWNVLADPEYAGMRRKYDSVRPMARFLASLSPSLRAQAMSGDGLSVNVLTPAQQEALSKFMPHAANTGGITFRVEYVPAGRYFWRVTFNDARDEEKWLTHPPLITGRTREEALAAARQVFSDVRPEDIARSFGQLAMTFSFADGTFASIGKRPPAVRIAH